MSNTLLNIPDENIPQFDELYVISDLHLGGEPGFQIFNSADELVRLINYLRDLSPKKKIALLINGDFVDFLAQVPSKYFDPDGAIDKLNKIAVADDSYFKPIFKALKNFVGKKGRRLIINLGNHDLELALPWVSEQLLGILTDEDARGRIILSLEGTGVRCRVGKASVLCVHGNEVDPWNIADYETIRRFGREVTQGRPIDSWIPNAGSQLVIDVMNQLKAKYPFIDLLKPETQAAIPTLLALAPQQGDKLQLIAATVRRLAWDKIKQTTGFLGKVETSLSGRVYAAADIFSGPENDSGGNSVFVLNQNQFTDLLLDEAETNFQKDVNPFALIDRDRQSDYLGFTSAVVKFFRGADTAEVLREALSDLGKDQSFSPSTEDLTFKLLDDKMGPDIDFLITGHTHLERALKRKNGPGWYFNSGTWARLIKLEDSVLKNSEEFKNIFETFGKGSMEALDALPKLVIRKLTVITVREESGKTYGELRHVNQAPNEPVLLPAEGYQFFKG